MTPNEAIELGYCVVSTRTPILMARIDRVDWREHMGDTHPQGDVWVQSLGAGAADRYRRSYSKDVRVIHVSWVSKLPASAVGPTEYIKGPFDGRIEDVRIE